MKTPRNPGSIPHSVLLDFLDDASDHLEDSRERLAALSWFGRTATGLAVVAQKDPCFEAADDRPDPLRHADPEGWRRELRDLADTAAGAPLWICGGAADSRAETAAKLWPGPSSRWPVRFVGDEQPDRRAFELGIAARIRTVRSRTPLWDGPYLLVPAALAESDGEALLEAFAEVADEREMLDLVVLGPLTPALERHARALGVGLRVHGAGACPLRAECTWLAGAAVVLWGAEAMPPVATLLRALEGPAPTVMVGEGRAAQSFAGRLGAHGVSVATARAESAAIAATLRLALERGAGVVDSVTRAAAFSAARTVEGAARQLSALATSRSASAAA